jgi:hypothetical protein
MLGRLPYRANLCAEHLQMMRDDGLTVKSCRRVNVSSRALAAELHTMRATLPLTPENLAAMDRKQGEYAAALVDGY